MLALLQTAQHNLLFSKYCYLWRKSEASVQHFLRPHWNFQDSVYLWWLKKTRKMQKHKFDVKSNFTTHFSFTWCFRNFLYLKIFLTSLLLHYYFNVMSFPLYSFFLSSSGEVVFQRNPWSVSPTTVVTLQSKRMFGSHPSNSVDTCFLHDQTKRKTLLFRPWFPG